VERLWNEEKVEKMSVVRAAVDVGSGSTKLVVARLAVASEALQEVLFERESEVLLAHNLIPDENGKEGAVRIDEVAFAKCREVLQFYKKKAEELGAIPPALSGVATQVFRTANNGQAFLKDLEVKEEIFIKLVTQTEEGKLGWSTARLVSNSGPENLVCWDSGGASFQLSWEAGSKVFEGPLGSSIVTREMSRIQGKKFTYDVVINPVNKKQAEGLREWIFEVLEKVQTPKPHFGGSTVVGIGGATCAFNMARIACCLGSGEEIKSFHQSESSGYLIERVKLRTSIDKLLDRSTEELISIGVTEDLQPNMTVPKVVLVEAVMSFLDLDMFKYFTTTGSCLGIISMNSIYETTEESEPRKKEKETT